MADRNIITAFRWILEIFKVADDMGRNQKASRKQPEYWCLCFTDLSYYLNKKELDGMGSVRGGKLLREWTRLINELTYSDHKDPTLN